MAHDGNVEKQIPEGANGGQLPRNSQGTGTVTLEPPGPAKPLQRNCSSERLGRASHPPPGGTGKLLRPSVKPHPALDPNIGNHARTVYYTSYTEWPAAQGAAHSEQEQGQWRKIPLGGGTLQRGPAAQARVIEASQHSKSGPGPQAKGEVQKKPHASHTATRTQVTPPKLARAEGVRPSAQEAQ